MLMPATPAEERLEQLLQAPDFAPPTEFAAQAKVADAAVYEQAAADPQAWWAGEARQRLDWDTPFATVLDDSNPPFYRWFADGTLNASYNCLDRHVQGGHGDRVAFHRHGEEGEQRDLTYAELLTDVQRLANGLKARGVKKGDVVWDLPSAMRTNPPLRRRPSASRSGPEERMTRRSADRGPGHGVAQRTAGTVRPDQPRRGNVAAPSESGRNGRGHGRRSRFRGAGAGGSADEQGHRVLRGGTLRAGLAWPAAGRGGDAGAAGAPQVPGLPGAAHRRRPAH